MLRIFFFGQVRLLVDGAPHPFRGMPKTLALWAYVLLHRRQALSRERVAFAFWPDESEERALANLRRHLYDLRRALPQPAGEGWLLIEGKTVQWKLGGRHEFELHRRADALARQGHASSRSV